MFPADTMAHFARRRRLALSGAIISLLALMVLQSPRDVVARPRAGQRPEPRYSKTVKRALKDPRYAKFLADDLAPSARTLRRWKREQKIKPAKSALWIDSQSIGQVLNIFEKAKGETHHLFVGNGMYPAYLVASALFAGTSMERHVHFLPVSGPLHEKAAKGRLLDRYYDHLRLAKLQGKLNIVDTVASGDTVRALAQTVRRYLDKKGEALASIRERVIATGIIEIGGRVRGMVHTPQKYAASMRKISDADLVAAKINPSQPFITAPWGGFFNSSYRPTGGEHYWGSKYTKRDNRGFPVSETGFHQALSERAVKSLLFQRKKRARSYLGMLAETAQVVRTDSALQQRVQAIAETQGSSSHALEDLGQDL